MKWLSHKQTPQPYPKDYNHQTDHLPTQTLSTCIAFDSKLSSLLVYYLFCTYYSRSINCSAHFLPVNYRRNYTTSRLRAGLRSRAERKREIEATKFVVLLHAMAPDGARSRWELFIGYFSAPTKVFFAQQGERKIVGSLSGRFIQNIFVDDRMGDNETIKI